MEVRAWVVSVPRPSYCWVCLLLCILVEDRRGSHDVNGKTVQVFVGVCFGMLVFEDSPHEVLHGLSNVL